MSNISSIPIYDPTRKTTSSSTSATSVEDLSQNFLKMLTVQLQNQDPLNPMDNAAMTSQLAALNTVDGINRLNNSVNSLVAQMQSANFMNLSSSVGKTAMAAGSDLYFGGQPVYMTARLANPASSLQALIKDASGAVVNQIDFGAVGAGDTDFIWDGYTDAGELASNGYYELELVASDSQGVNTKPTSYIGSLVASIGQEASDILVGLGDGRQISATDILKWVAV